MQTQTDVSTAQKLQKPRDIYADGPELGKKAIENVLLDLTTQVAETPPPPIDVDRDRSSTSEAPLRSCNMSQRMEPSKIDAKNRVFGKAVAGASGILLWLDIGQIRVGR